MRHRVARRPREGKLAPTASEGALYHLSFSIRVRETLHVGLVPDVANPLHHRTRKRTHNKTLDASKNPSTAIAVPSLLSVSAAALRFLSVSTLRAEKALHLCSPFWQPACISLWSIPAGPKRAFSGELKKYCPSIFLLHRRLLTLQTDNQCIQSLEVPRSKPPL